MESGPNMKQNNYTPPNPNRTKKLPGSKYPLARYGSGDKVILGTQKGIVIERIPADLELEKPGALIIKWKNRQLPTTYSFEHYPEMQLTFDGHESN